MAQEVLTPYRVLGIDLGANAETIKRAFRERSKLVHPDRCKDPAAAEKFRQLVDARETLLNQESLAWVDRRAGVSRDSIFF